MRQMDGPMNKTELWMNGAFRIAETLLIINEAALARIMIEPQATNATEGLMLKSAGQSGRKYSSPRDVVL